MARFSMITPRRSPGRRSSVVAVDDESAARDNRAHTHRETAETEQRQHRRETTRRQRERERTESHSHRDTESQREASTQSAGRRKK